MQKKNRNFYIYLYLHCIMLYFIFFLFVSSFLSNRMNSVRGSTRSHSNLGYAISHDDERHVVIFTFIYDAQYREEGEGEEAENAMVMTCHELRFKLVVLRVP